jgi:ubiquitin conjugation factor E4 B
MERCAAFYGSNPDKFRADQMHTLNNAMGAYHSELVKIFSSLMGQSTRKQTLVVIKEFIKDCESISRDGFMMVSSNKTKKMEAFGFHLEHVLISLALKYKNKVNTISSAALYHPSSITPITEDTPLIALKGSVANWVDPRNDSRKEMFKVAEAQSEDEKTRIKENLEWSKIISAQPEPTLAPQLFFAAAQMLEYVSATFIRLIRQISRRIHHLKGQARENPVNKVQIDEIIKRLKMINLVIHTHLTFEEKLIELNQFFLMALDYLKSEGNYDEISAKLPDQPPVAYQHIPEYVINSVASVANYLVDMDFLKKPEFIIPRFSAIFSNPNFIRSPFVKNQIVQFFAKVANDIDKKHLVIGIPHILEHMLPSVVVFFSAVQITGSHSEFYDKFEFRDGCQDLLKLWFRFNEFREFFKKHCHEKPYEELVFHLVDDNLYFVGQALSFFQSLSTHEEHEDDPAATNEIISIREQLHYWMRSVNKAFELIYSITGFCPEVFDTETVSEKFSTLAICSVYACVMQDNILTIKNPGEIEWDKYSFFSIVASSIAQCTSDVFIHNFVSNERYFSTELLDKTMDLLYERGCAQTIIDSFEIFVQLAKAEDERLKSEEINYDDAPDEYLDPVMFTLMMDPVRLPGGDVVERSTYEQLLLSTRLSPYTQIPIKEGDAVPADDIKAKIQDYIKQKKAQKK